MQTPTIRRTVREEIQRRILSGESRPGERVAQQSLAKELGVGQGSVREALVELQWLGLIDSVDRMGAFVGILDATHLCEAYEIREYLDGLAARRACRYASPSDVWALRDLADSILNLSDKNKEEAMSAADRAFHLKITQLSGNKVLIRLAEVHRVLGMVIRSFRDPHDVHQEHLRIVEAIDRNLPSEAERLARFHVSETRRAIEGESTKKVSTGIK